MNESIWYYARIYGDELSESGGILCGEEGSATQIGSLCANAMHQGLISGYKIESQSFSRDIPLEFIDVALTSLCSEEDLEKVEEIFLERLDS